MKETVDRIYESGVFGNKALIKRIILAYQDLVRQDVMSGKSVQLKGLCTFVVTDEPEKTRKSFGKEVVTPARKEVKVKVSSTLKEIVRNS